MSWFLQVTWQYYLIRYQFIGVLTEELQVRPGYRQLALRMPEEYSMSLVCALSCITRSHGNIAGFLQP